MYRTKQLYDDWNQLKQDFHFLEASQIQTHSDKFINTGEIRYISLGLNIGFEENGKQNFRRPALVIKKVGNLFFIVALTSKGKDKNRFYHKLYAPRFNERNLTYQDSSYCILSQVRVIDKKRFTEAIGTIGSEEFCLIKQKLRELLL